MTENGQETTWIPLKDAARMLGCSVKTIRRRIKAGAWRSMIEYQGQKAIRLVAREDVLKESGFLSRLPADSPESAIALQTLDGLPGQLGDLFQSHLLRLQGDLDRSARRLRLYILISAGLAAVIVTGLVLYLVRQEGELLNSRLEAVSGTLSTTLDRNRAELRSNLDRSARELAAVRGRAEETGLVLGDVSVALGEMAEENRRARQEAEAAREEIGSLRRQVGRLEEALRVSQDPPAPPGVEEAAAEEPDSAEEESVVEEPAPTGQESVDPTPVSRVPEPATRERTSRFLGIF